MNRDYFMGLALIEAKKAQSGGEVPVGCVVVREDKVVGAGHNTRENDHDATAHAEVAAIREACRKLGGWRLSDCTLYVTLEPCAMCAGAIINARVGEVVYGARDSVAGACGSVLNLFEEGFGHKPRVYGGVRSEECAGMLREFFEGRR
jgi:tRNA(adenine34) deaminase